MSEIDISELRSDLSEVHFNVATISHAPNTRVRTVDPFNLPPGYKVSISYKKIHCYIVF